MSTQKSGPRSAERGATRKDIYTATENTPHATAELTADAPDSELWAGLCEPDGTPYERSHPAWGGAS